MKTTAPASTASVITKVATTVNVHSVASVTTTASVLKEATTVREATTASVPTAAATATTATTAAPKSPTAVVPSRATHGTLMPRTPSAPAITTRVAKATMHVPASIVREAMDSVPQVADSVSVLPVVDSKRAASVTTNIVRRSRSCIVRR